MDLKALSAQAKQAVHDHKAQIAVAVGRATAVAKQRYPGKAPQIDKAEAALDQKLEEM
jgi:hypothetical protein